MNLKELFKHNINHISKILFILILFKLSLFQFNIINHIPFQLGYIFLGLVQLIEEDINFIIYYGLLYFTITILIYKLNKHQILMFLNLSLYITITSFILLNYISIIYMNRLIYLNDILNISITNLFYIYTIINYKYLLLLLIPMFLFFIKFNKWFIIFLVSLYFISSLLYLCLLTNKYNVYNNNFVTNNSITNLISSMFITNKYLLNINEYKEIKINNSNKINIFNINQPKNIFIFSLESINHKYFTNDNMPFLYSLLNNSIIFNNLYTTFPYTKDSLLNLYLSNELELYNIKYNNFLNIEYNKQPKVLNSFKTLGYNLKFDTSSISSLNGSFFDKEFFNTNFIFNDFESLKKYNNDVFKEKDSLNLVLSNIKEKDFQGYLTSINHWPYYTFDEFDLDKSKDLSLDKYILSLKKLDNIYKELFIKYHVLYDSLILFVADHGQGFNEHNFKTHNELYNEVLHIPGFIYYKEFNKLEIDNYYSQSNLLPTILSLLNKKIESDSIFDNQINRFLISTNLFKISAIDKLTNIKYFFVKNECFKFDLNKDYNEKNKLNCNDNDEDIIKMIFNNIKRK